MIDQKEKNVLAELMQFGYERTVIANTDMGCDSELEEQLESLLHAVIQPIWEWYNSSEKQYSSEEKLLTVMRFCFTAGIGAQWFWYNKKEEVLAKGLFDCMAQPRTVFEMDEYIEDVTGIWWSNKSYEHKKYSYLFHDCFDIVNRYYDLSDKEQEQNAGHVLMLFGMYCELTRILHDKIIEPYRGETHNHWEIWEALHCDGQESDEYDKMARKAITDCELCSVENVIFNDPKSEYGKSTNKFVTFTYKKNAGIKTLAKIDDDNKITLENATPVFNTMRNYVLIIDNVYVWESGAEATIRAHFADDEGYEITFYDINYLENKDRYFYGAVYVFDLYGIAYKVDVVPEQDRSFSFEGEKAMSFNEKIGRIQEYYDNGNPKPVKFDMSKMHAFVQSNDKIPEDASFQCPMLDIMYDFDYIGKPIYEVEIGMPYHDLENEDKEHHLSVYMSSNNFEQVPDEEDPIRGVLYLLGYMRKMINLQEAPSKVLHSFAAKRKDGKISVFKHICNEGEEGMPMTEEEQMEFAREVYFQQLNKWIKIEKDVRKTDEKQCDFYPGRGRELWVKADVNYTAETDFIDENKEKYLVRAYGKGVFPVIAYISLFDTKGDRCKWVKGGRYTAKISYGSVLPGQKMKIESHKNHDELVEILFNSIKDLDTQVLANYLHNNLDYRSAILPDPIITREEYLVRTDSINKANKRAKNGPVKPKLIQDKDNGAYIELRYPSGIVDIMNVKTEAGFITSIRVSNNKNSNYDE